VARILIVGGGCRGRRLASAMTADGLGHAVRITTRSQDGRAAIEEVGAECWVGTPDRLATLRGALENVTVVCWLLRTAKGSAAELRALHSTRLEFFLGQAIDTTMRGFVYETTTENVFQKDRHAGCVPGHGAGSPRDGSHVPPARASPPHDAQLGPETPRRTTLFERRSKGDAAAVVDPIGGSAGEPLPSEAIATGERIVRTAGERNAIPVAFLRADPASSDVWAAQARMLVGSLLGDPC
jgi:hypothetical protein